VSCPNWSALVAFRDARGGDPPGWEENLAHLDACPACRRQALAADPTLAFRRLPRPDVKAADIDAIRQGVAALREASRLGLARPEPPPAGHEDGRTDEGEPRQGRRGWGWLPGATRIAAAVVLVVVALALAPGNPLTLGDFTPITTAAREGVTSPAGVEATMPLIEDLDLPDPRVYQIAEEDIQVVMVFDESLDLDL